jgi:hypothetical protein
VRCTAPALAVLSAAIALVGGASGASAREQTIDCCLRVTIDTYGVLYVNYGEKSDSKDQSRAGSANIYWQYEVRGLAQYLEGDRPFFVFLRLPGSGVHWAAVYSASFLEHNQVDIHTGMGDWYPELTNANDCRDKKTKRVDILGTPWTTGWGNEVQQPAILLEPNCQDAGHASDADVRFFAPTSKIATYIDLWYTFPSAHVKDLRAGTMHAATNCVVSRFKPRRAVGDYEVKGFFSERIAFDSFKKANLPEQVKALRKFVGKTIPAAKAFSSDPVGFFNDLPNGFAADAPNDGCYKPGVLRDHSPSPRHAL